MADTLIFYSEFHTSFLKPNLFYSLQNFDFQSPQDSVNSIN